MKTVDSEGRVKGGILAATQAEMEAATSTTLAVTPGRTKYHPGTAKGWVDFNGSGTVSVRDSFNVSSITDDGTGNYTVNWDTDFSNANYAMVLGANDGQIASGAPFATHVVGYIDSINFSGGSLLYSASQTRVRFINPFNSGLVADPFYVLIAAYGDQ